MERPIDTAPAVLERLTGAALDTIAADGAASPRVLRFLLRSYAASGREDIAGALGVALASALTRVAADDAGDRGVEWAMLFVEATGLSDDERMQKAADDMVERLRRGWAGRLELRPLMRSIAVAIRHVERRPPDAPADDLLEAAIDCLEQTIGRAYRPGGGVAPAGPGGAPEAARLADQFAAGLALTAAYRATARLPYAMLAEELVQFARRTWWAPDRELFADEASDNVAANCDAVALLTALGDLHDDAEYRRAAVVAADANYLADALGVLAALGRVVSADNRDDVAAFGIVLRDWQLR